MQSTPAIPQPPAYLAANDDAPSQTAASKSQRPRYRASTACASCRGRRIRCVVRPGESECLNCKRTGSDCIIGNDDKRRKPVSRAYVASLTDRIALLEALLRRNGGEPSPAIHPPCIRSGLHGGEGAPFERKNNPLQEPSTTAAVDDSLYSQPEHRGEQSIQIGVAGRASSAPRLLNPSEESQSLVSQILSPRGHLGMDKNSGGVRYFASPMNWQLHSEKAAASSRSSQMVEHARRATKTIRLLLQETHDYLMDLFWEHFNAVLHVIHKNAFLDEYEHGSSHFYSPFLHVCILAVGFRYADKSRPDIQRIALPLRESTFHREAKYMLDVELDRPGGIPQVQALLLLANCEYSVGRDHTGWLYSGMAIRLAFDIGLHLDTRSSGLPEREVDVRHMTLWACVIFDRYWSLLLGRPTAIKSSDLEVYTLPKRFKRLGACLPNGPGLPLEIRIYEALIDLMEIESKAAESRDVAAAGRNFDRNAYRLFVAMDRELNNWYARLPEVLEWEPSNIQSAPKSFFTLHQQYHSMHIHIRRPFTRYEEFVPPDTKDISWDSVIMSARKACTSHAIAVVRNFWHYRQRFSAKQIFCAAMQTAGTACTTLVADLASAKAIEERKDLIKYLKCMAVSLQEMATIFQPAERMCLILQHVLAEISQRRPEREGSIIPASRKNAEDDSNQNAPKRRQRSDPPPTTTLRRSDGWGSILQVKSNVDSFSPIPDSQSDRGSIEGGALFAPQGDLVNWPLRNPDGQMGGSSLPTSAPTMCGANMPPNAWMLATSQMPDMAQDELLAFYRHFRGQRQVSHSSLLGFLQPDDGASWENRRLEHSHSS